MIRHGYVTKEDAGWPGYTFTVFQVTGFTYMRTGQGRVTGSYSVPKDFNPADLPDDADPGLIRIMEVHRRESVFDALSAPTEGEADEAQNGLEEEE